MTTTTELKLVLITAILARITERGWTQYEAAEHLGVTQPRISELRNRNLRQLGLDRLIRYTEQLGLTIGLTIQSTANPEARP